jgi:tryptophan synthase beta chain
MEQTKVLLADRDIPRQWYNILADMPTPMRPPLHPATGQPVGPQDLAPIFPMNLIELEVSGERWIDIPEAVLEKYLLWRPSPLIRARRFEQLLDAPVRIYYKHEGTSPAGSHKPNAAIPQAYYNKVFGTKRMTTETAPVSGEAPEHGLPDVRHPCRVYMVRVSMTRNPTDE